MDRVGRWAPRATRRVRLAIASTMWTVVGLGLTVAGVHFTRVGGGSWVWLLPALAVGALKGRFVLARRAEANARRIEASDERICVGAIFSWPMWGLVLFFMGLGAALRHSPLPRFWLGLVYVAVGSALAAASTVSWRRWRALA